MENLNEQELKTKLDTKKKEFEDRLEKLQTRSDNLEKLNNTSKK